jgi:hypothetical protein
MVYLLINPNNIDAAYSFDKALLLGFTKSYELIKLLFESFIFC